MSMSNICYSGFGFDVGELWALAQKDDPAFDGIDWMADWEDFYESNATELGIAAYAKPEYGSDAASQEDVDAVAIAFPFDTSDFDAILFVPDPYAVLPQAGFKPRATMGRSEATDLLARVSKAYFAALDELGFLSPGAGKALSKAIDDHACTLFEEQVWFDWS